MNPFVHKRSGNLRNSEEADKCYCGTFIESNFPLSDVFLTLVFSGKLLHDFNLKSNLQLKKKDPLVSLFLSYMDCMRDMCMDYKMHWKWKF